MANYAYNITACLSRALETFIFAVSSLSALFEDQSFEKFKATQTSVRSVLPQLVRCCWRVFSDRLFFLEERVLKHWLQAFSLSTISTVLSCSLWRDLELVVTPCTTCSCTSSCNCAGGEAPCLEEMTGWRPLWRKQDWWEWPRDGNEWLDIYERGRCTAVCQATQLTACFSEDGVLEWKKKNGKTSSIPSPVHHPPVCLLI